MGALSALSDDEDPLAPDEEVAEVDVDEEALEEFVDDLRLETDDVGVRDRRRFGGDEDMARCWSGCCWAKKSRFRGQAGPWERRFIAMRR